MFERKKQFSFIKSNNKEKHKIVYYIGLRYRVNVLKNSPSIMICVNTWQKVYKVNRVA